MIDAASPTAELPEYSWPADLMTVSQVAAMVLLTPKTVRQHIRGGHLRAVRRHARGGYRVRREDAQAWAAAHVVRAERKGKSIDQLVAARRRRGLLAGAPRAARPPEAV
jgi:excisionase family DNA binding protein